MSKPFMFEGNKLYANMETSSCGYIYFELSDKKGNVITSCEMFGNSTEKLVGFDKELSDFEGKEVVLSVRMMDADLYSIQFLGE